MGPRSRLAVAERSRWKMSEAGLIGPNAILQMMPVLERMAGPEGALRLLRKAGVRHLPDGSEMIPEEDAARLHQWVRGAMGDRAAKMAAEAGRSTGQYILAHRIPRAAQRLLRVLPAGLSARVLSQAIARHAWTFAGSGRFEVINPWRFEIQHNPLVRGEQNQSCLCHWHAAVFETLYQELVHPSCTCREVACGAQPGQEACIFDISRA